MNYFTKILPIITISLFVQFVMGQEYSSLKHYTHVTGQNQLKDGCWLTKDRKKQTEIWHKANLFNLSVEKGNEKYKSISQICDFYSWFDQVRIQQGHEIYWIAIASVATHQLCKMDNALIRTIIVGNKEVVQFANEGSKMVLDFAFPLLHDVYFSADKIVGVEAENWAAKYGMQEQCTILEPLYQELSPKALHKLTKMVKGKGIFALGVPGKLKFEGSIENCNARFQHGINKLLPYYKTHQLKKHPHHKLNLEATHEIAIN